jgi:hypothetical protein
MPESPKSTKRGKGTRLKARFAVRSPLALIKYLRRWVSWKEVPVSTAAEEAVSRLVEELRAERKKMFQRPKADRKT